MRLPRSLSLVLVLLASGEAWAARNYGMAGCGLGSLVFSPDGGQISAATTNGTYGNQAFGITSGTSNCKTDAEMAVISRQQEFLAANLATLQKEMAQGSGDTIVGFLEVLGCSASAMDKGSNALLDAYPRIFSAPGIEGVLDTAKAELRPALATECKHLS